MTTAWLLILAALRRLFRLSPTQPDVPGDDDREASGDPVQHEGATENWSPTKETDLLPSPDLIRPSEQMVADHEALATISVALDDFDRVVSNAISRFLRNQPTVLLRLPSSIEHTGELPVVELVGAS